MLTCQYHIINSAEVCWTSCTYSLTDFSIRGLLYTVRTHRFHNKQPSREVSCIVRTLIDFPVRSQSQRYRTSRINLPISQGKASPIYCASCVQPHSNSCTGCTFHNAEPVREISFIVCINSPISQCTASPRDIVHRVYKLADFTMQSQSERYRASCV